ncbi:sulfite exporter TauE/SafE family protein [Gillisia sp. CAL575]|uniref:sulfite exporter TauE/SafE family protein n=1 Tax=Gillisia sp. CAL575 TaxID=985255 RepID=UPI0003A6377E|nr:sulfite exporter TauE/SafE family protein [Gillisia sp. CAL575]
MEIELYIIVALAIFFGFFVQTVVGFAGSLIALPILLVSIALPDAIAYISIFYIFSSVFLINKEWNNIDFSIIYKLAIPTIIGVIIGILVLAFTNPVILKKGLGIFIILYVLYVSLIKANFKVGRKLVVMLGILGGFFSGVFSTGGPLYVISVKNLAIDVKTFRATMIGIMGLITLVRIPMLSVSGILNLSHWKVALIIFPVFLLAQYIGKVVYSKINEFYFKKVLLVLLFFSGTVLIIN